MASRSAPVLDVSAGAETQLRSRRALLAGLRAELLGVIALALLAGVVRYPYLWLEPRITDEWREAQRGLLIAQGHGFPATNVAPYIGALWNYLLAIAYLILGDDLRVPRLVAMLLGALTVVPTYLLGRELGGRLVALLAALLMVTSPVHVLTNSHIAWSNCITPLFTTAGLWLLVGAARRADGRWLALSGLAFGLAFQTHPTALAVLPGALLYLWQRGRPLLRGIWLPLAGALFLVASLNVVVFITAYPADFFGSIQSRQEDYNRRAPPTFVQRYWTNAGYLWLSLGRLPSGAVLTDNNWAHILAHPLIWLYAGALGAGAVLSARRGQPLAADVDAPALVLLPLFQPGSYYPVPDGRYAMPLLPVLYASLAYALTRPSTQAATPLPARPSSPLRPLWAQEGLLRRLLPGGRLAALLILALALIPLGPIRAYYAADAERRAVYSRLWETLLLVQQTMPRHATVLLDENLKAIIDENNTEKRTESLLDMAGFDARYQLIDPADPAVAISDRHAVYLLTCQTYQAGRRTLGLVPLDAGAPDDCQVLRAARLP